MILFRSLALKSKNLAPSPHFSFILAEYFLKFLPYADKYFSQTYTHTHTHTYIYIYIYMLVEKIEGRPLGRHRLRSERNIEIGCQFGIILIWQADDCIQGWRFINS